MARKARACVPCHERKVRCDAADIGLPCTRCINADRSVSCELVQQDRLQGGKRKRANAQPVEGERSESLAESASAPYPSRPRSEPAAATPRFSDHDLSIGREEIIPRLSTSGLPQEPLGQPTSVAGNVATNPISHSAAQLHSPFESSESASSSTQVGQPVGENDFQLQVCREMSQWQSAAPLGTPTSSSPQSKGQEIMEYHGGTNSMTILSEVLGRAPPKRLVRIVLRDPGSDPRHQLESTGLDDADIEYLQRKGALDLPPPHLCDEFLRLYFQFVYIYAPVIDRIQFLRDYRNGTVSKFLFYSILASVTPYAPTNLIRDIGFENYQSAQKTFIDRARLLYDVGVEKNQLHQLQGSLVLSHLYVSLYTEKDYRYWLSNAVRIATKMGLHKEEVGKNAGLPLRKLLRRVWWVLYNRDALLVFNGLDNLRRIHDTDFDTLELTLEDWDNGTIPEEFEDILQPVTKLHKSFLVASCQLSLITSQVMQTMTRTPVWSETTWDELEKKILRWQKDIPPELHCSANHEWGVDNFWVLVLEARIHVFKCMVYRTARDAFKSRNLDISHRATQKLHHAMLELDTIIDRIMVHGLVEYCPMFL
ncbi:hypothetical protein AAEP93_005007 [Penicillium crustosum]